MRENVRSWYRKSIIVGLSILLMLAEGSDQVNAATSSKVASFFKGKHVVLIIPYSPGGGYDLYARLLAPFMERHTGATVIPTNVPGAGNLIGVNKLYNARPDGLTIGFFNGPAGAGSQLEGQQGVKFDMNRMTMLGRMTADDLFVLVSAKSPFNTFNNLIGARDKEIIWATEGKGSAPYQHLAITSDLLKLRRIKMLTGYPGSPESNLAILRGDADGTMGSYESRRSLIDTGELIPVVSLTRKRSALFPKTATIYEIPGLDENDRRFADFLSAKLEIGRILVAPPGMDREKVDFLRSAFRRTIEDKDLLTRAKKEKKSIEYLNHGEVEQLVKTFLQPSADIRKKYGDVMKRLE